ncbi:MAG: peptidylprolyl isomerase [Pyrinomonadaceae bacterium]
MFKTFFFLILVAALTSLGFGQAVTSTPETKEPAKANARPTPTPPAVKPEPFDKADVKTMAAQCVIFDTELGVIEMEMFPEHAPESVRSFLNLAATGMFDTTTFGRVVPGFVIQGGDLYSREGKVTYEIGMRARRTLPDEPSKILHERGILSMARGEEANTAMTSFFILVGSGSHLDGKFAAFGRVTKGMEVVDAINKAPVNEEKPEKPVRIKKASVAACAEPAKP